MSPTSALREAGMKTWVSRDTVLVLTPIAVLTVTLASMERAISYSLEAGVVG